MGTSGGPLPAPPSRGSSRRRCSMGPPPHAGSTRRRCPLVRNTVLVLGGAIVHHLDPVDRGGDCRSQAAGVPENGARLWSLRWWRSCWICRDVDHDGHHRRWLRERAMAMHAPRILGRQPRRCRPVHTWDVYTHRQPLATMACRRGRGCSRRGCHAGERCAGSGRGSGKVERSGHVHGRPGVTGRPCRKSTC